MERSTDEGKIRVEGRKFVRVTREDRRKREENTKKGIPTTSLKHFTFWHLAHFV